MTKWQQYQPKRAFPIKRKARNHSCSTQNVSALCLVIDGKGTNYFDLSNF